MKTGGPAFPLVSESPFHISAKGMTLRDYFAAKALQGFISRGDHYDCDFDAERAYNFADAMLEAREQNGN